VNDPEDFEDEEEGDATDPTKPQIAPGFEEIDLHDDAKNLDETEKAKGGASGITAAEAPVKPAGDLDEDDGFVIPATFDIQGGSGERKQTGVQPVPNAEDDRREKFVEQVVKAEQVKEFNAAQVDDQAAKLKAEDEERQKRIRDLRNEEAIRKSKLSQLSEEERLAAIAEEERLSREVARLAKEEDRKRAELAAAKASNAGEQNQLVLYGHLSEPGAGLKLTNNWQIVKVPDSEDLKITLLPKTGGIISFKDIRVIKPQNKLLQDLHLEAHRTKTWADFDVNLEDVLKIVEHHAQDQVEFSNIKINLMRVVALVKKLHPNDPPIFLQKSVSKHIARMLILVRDNEGLFLTFP